MVINSKNSLVNNYLGLTLVEILVSMVIFALIMAGLANLFTATKRLTLHSRYRITAGELGRYFLDPLQMGVRQDEWGSNCVSTNGINTGGCDITKQTIDNTTYTPEYEKSLVAGIRKVKLTVSWPEPSP